MMPSPKRSIAASRPTFRISISLPRKPRGYLLREGISPENISVTGNTVIDALLIT